METLSSDSEPEVLWQMSGSSGCLWSLSSDTSSLLSSCCISILGRPHLPAESKNSGGCLQLSHPTHRAAHTPWKILTTLTPFPPFLRSQVCFAQSLMGSSTCSLIKPALWLTLPLSPSSGYCQGCMGASLLLGQCQKCQHSQRAAPSLSSQGCPESSVLCSSKITPLSNFEISTHHCSSLEQK